MLPAPATEGAKVRTIGTKRAIMIVLPPCRSKNWWVRSRYRLLEDAGVGAESPSPDSGVDRVVDRVTENRRRRQRQKQQVNVHRADGG